MNEWCPISFFSLNHKDVNLTHGSTGKERSDEGVVETHVRLISGHRGISSLPRSGMEERHPRRGGRGRISRLTRIRIGGAHYEMWEEVRLGHLIEGACSRRVPILIRSISSRVHFDLPGASKVRYEPWCGGKVGRNGLEERSFFYSLNMSQYTSIYQFSSIYLNIPI